MKKHAITALLALILMMTATIASAQSRRPIDNKHPMWLVHIDVWNNADPQKIIDLIPEDIKPYVVMNLSLSCAYDDDLHMYKKPQNALQTYRSWASVCCRNNMFFTCQPASGGRTHILDNPAHFDEALEIHESFFKDYPNFLGWNYAEQFWGFNENSVSSSSDVDRMKLFAALVPMHHKYGGVLTISFCGNIWSHPLNPVGMYKRNNDFLNACKQYPEAMLWLYKYTTSANWYNNESVSMGPFISGLAKNYGVRYDNCGWNGAIDEFVKEGKSLHGDGLSEKYPGAVGIAPVLEQTALNGACVWDGPELIWTEDFQGLANSTVDGYTRRNWGRFPNFDNIWIDMFRKVIDGTIHIPSREEVLARTKVVIKNDISAANDGTSLKINAYAAPIDLYHGLYWQDDPFNARPSNEGGIGDIAGYGNNNFLYFKKTGRYATIPVVIDLYDDTAKNAGMQVINRSTYNSTYQNNQSSKVNLFNQKYPDAVIDAGDLFVARHKNALVCYFPFSDHKKENGTFKTTSYGRIPLKYNKCSNMELTLGLFGSAHAKEYSDHIDFYLNNFNERESREVRTDVIKINGASSKPSYNVTSNRCNAEVTENWSNGVYTVNVKHCGPLDLRINCTGNNSRSGGAMVDDAALDASGIAKPNSNDLEYQPLVIEAEDFDFKSVKSCVTDAYNSDYRNVLGQSSMGFIDMGTNTQASLRYIGKAIHTGDHTISIKYIATEAGSLTVNVNGTSKSCNYDATATDFNGQDSWGTIELKAPLWDDKDNTIFITNTGGKALYIDNVTFTPENDRLNANEYGNVKYDSETNRYYFYTPYYAAFIFDNFKGRTLQDCAELTIKSGSNNTTGYRLDIQLYKADGTLIEDGSTDSSAEKYMIGTEDKGTRLTQMQGSVSYDLQKLFAYYIEKYPGCKIGNIRINTVVGQEDTNREGKYYITINNMSIQENHLTATDKPSVALYDIPMFNYNNEKDGKLIEECATGDYDKNFGQDLAAGATVYGPIWGGVISGTYIDLKGYNTTMRIQGTSGSTLRIMLNRKINYTTSSDGDFVEINPTIGSNGTVDVDLSGYEYVHLNSVKVAWGSSANISRIDVIGSEGTKSLADMTFCKYDVTRTTANPTKAVLDGTTQIENGSEVYGVNGNVYYRDYTDLTPYNRMVIKGSGGTLRVLFNRTTHEGPLTEKTYSLSTGEATIDLTQFEEGYAHLHSIKAAWGNTVAIESIQLYNDNADFADYYLYGAGYRETSATGALNAVNATAIDINNLTNDTEQIFASANPNCLFYGTVNNLLQNGMRNVVYKTENSYSAPSVQLEDGYEYRAPVNVSTDNATYTRNLTTTWASMALPFSVEISNNPGTDIFLLKSVDGTTMTFEKVESGTLSAGSVILYRSASSGETVLHGKNLGKTAEGLNIQPIAGLPGWYTAQSFTNRVIADVATDPELKGYEVYGISGDQFVHATKKVTLKPFRAFFLQAKNANAKTRYSIAVKEDATGIEQNETSAAATEAERYNAAGQRINSLQPGLNIIRMSDGSVRKIMVR